MNYFFVVKRCRFSYFFASGAQRCPKRVPRAPKEAKSAKKGAQSAQKGAQMEPQGTKNHTKVTPNIPRTRTTTQQDT